MEPMTMPAMAPPLRVVASVVLVASLSKVEVGAVVTVAVGEGLAVTVTVTGGWFWRLWMGRLRARLTMFWISLALASRGRWGAILVVLSEVYAGPGGERVARV